jgi:serine/threonine protein kinase
MLAALAYVHGKDVVHKDIKPQNILVKDNKIYLADFGLSRDFEGGISRTIGPFAGTPEYQAPEFALNQQHGRSVDNFALGCVFSEVLTALRGKSLAEFRQRRLVLVPGVRESNIYSFHQNLDQVEKWVIALRDDERDDLIINIILGMLKVDFRNRMSSQEALERLYSQKELCCTHRL